MSSPRLDRIRTALEAPVDAAALALFRILVGFVCLVEVGRYLWPSSSGGRSYVQRYFVDADFHGTYWGFEWVVPWAGDGMLWHYGLIGVAAACVMLGFCYRLAAPAYLLLFSYAFLAEKARYLNHHYLMILVAFMMTLVPANRCWSLDAWLGWTRRGDTVPAWCLWAFRVQFGLVYFYGGLAKFTPDWLAGLPVRNMVAKSHDLPLIGPHVGEAWFIYFIAYAGLLIDLVAFPALLHPRTRVPMALVLLAFHLSNSAMFSIGIFPWFMIATTLIFFPPEFLRRLAAGWVRGLGAATLQPWLERVGEQMTAPPEDPQPEAGPCLVVGVLALHLVLQVLLPLRHHLVPGNPEWHEVGHAWAWRMKLRSRSATMRVVALNLDTLHSFEVPYKHYLESFQVKKVAQNPDMAHQFALYLVKQLKKKGHQRVDIRVLSAVSLNRRQPQLLIDPMVNLAAQPRVFGVPPWVLPLTEPAPGLMERRSGSTRRLVNSLDRDELFQAAIAAERARRARARSGKASNG